ncbi:MAG: threonine dehydratase [Pirellulaceae bacterium]
MFTREELDAAAKYVGETIQKTPAHRWELLCQAAGCELVVKHENHTLVGAFKVRGGLTYLRDLLASGKRPPGLITATRGNHGQSIPFAASRAGLPTVVLVPEGNSTEKNEAMKSLGAEIIVHGRDFEESRQEANRRSAELGYLMVPSFHRSLCLGVATYALELFTDHPDLDAVYVPIGMGSGICGLITVRDLLGLKTKIIGVIAENAPAFALSFAAEKPVNTDTAHTFIDGVACRSPMEEPVDIVVRGAERLVQVSEDEVAEAMRLYFSATHNVAEPAGAAPLAGLLKEREQMAGQKAAVILCGGNVDSAVFAEVLRGDTPQVS